MQRSKVVTVLGTLLFALVIPTILFLKAYPGGARDMFNRIKFEHIVNSHPNVLNLKVAGVFSFVDPDYWATILQIQMAPADTKVMLTVEDNFGGAAIMLSMVEQAIQSSKALVVVTVKHFGLSCGTYIVNSGNFLMLPNDSLLLFHMGQVNDKVTHDGSNDPEIIEAAAEVHTIFEPFRTWITTDEYKLFTEGKNIWVTGADICQGRNGRKADILFFYKDGCVIRGVK